MVRLTPNMLEEGAATGDHHTARQEFLSNSINQNKEEGSEIEESRQCTENCAAEISSQSGFDENCLDAGKEVSSQANNSCDRALPVCESEKSESGSCEVGGSDEAEEAADVSTERIDQTGAYQDNPAQVIGSQDSSIESRGVSKLLEEKTDKVHPPHQAGENDSSSSSCSPTPANVEEKELTASTTLFDDVDSMEALPDADEETPPLCNVVPNQESLNEIARTAEQLAHNSISEQQSEEQAEGDVLGAKQSFDASDISVVAPSTTEDAGSPTKMETTPQALVRKLIVPTSITISTRNHTGNTTPVDAIPLELPSLESPASERRTLPQGLLIDSSSGGASSPAPVVTRGMNRSRLLEFMKNKKGGPWYRTTSYQPHQDSFEDDLTASTLGFCPFECICGRGEACAGISAAFYMLHDPRAGYSEVPSFWSDALSSENGRDVQKLREALVAYVMDSEEDDLDNAEEPKFVAHHHFHPEVVLHSTEQRNRALPMFIAQEDIVLNNMQLDDVDRVLDEEGEYTGDYFVVPSYGFDKSAEDMRNIVWVRQTEEGAELPSLEHPESAGKRGKGLGEDVPELIGYNASHNKVAFQSESANDSILDDEASTRSDVFEALEDFESARESFYTTRLESICIEWSSSTVKTLLNTCDEVKQATQLVKKSALKKAMPVFGDRPLAVYVTACMTHSVARFLEDVKEQVSKVEQVGNFLVAELACAEARVTNAWKACRVIDAERRSDFWIVEMCYRVSVAYQASLWKKAAKELSHLFASVLESRYERCMAMNGLLLDFVSQQEQLLTSEFQDEDDVPTVDEESKKHDQDIQELIDRVAAEGRNSSQLVFDMKKSPVDEPEDGYLSVKSPMTSSLVRAAEVMERKCSTGWQPVLVVVTSDRFLHVFDLPYTTDLSSLTPGEAFTQLLPHLHLPTVGNGSMRGTPSTDRHLLRYLTPKRTLFLPRCSTNQKLPPERRVFKVSESRKGKNRSDSSKKIYLQAKSHQEAVAWLDIVRRGFLPDI